MASLSFDEGQLRELIFKDVCEWFEAYLEPLSLRTISQRYNKHCTKLGLRVIEMTRRDSRLLVKELKSGSRVVLPKELFNAAFVGNEAFNYWVALKVKM